MARWGTSPARPLGSAFPRLREAGRDAERLAAALLQPDPSRRLAAHRALHHAYFASLPPRLLELPDGMLSYKPSSTPLSMDREYVAQWGTKVCHQSNTSATNEKTNKSKTITVSFILISLTARERDGQTFHNTQAVRRHATCLFTDTTQAKQRLSFSQPMCNGLYCIVAEVSIFTVEGVYHIHTTKRGAHSKAPAADA